MMYILYLITLFAFIASLIAAVYYFRKYNKLRNRLPGISIDGKRELMKPYNLLIHELEEKQQQLKQQNLQHRLLVKAIKLKLWKWDLKRKEIIWDGDLEKDEQGVTVVNADEHLSMKSSYIRMRTILYPGEISMAPYMSMMRTENLLF